MERLLPVIRLANLLFKGVLGLVAKSVILIALARLIYSVVTSPAVGFEHGLDIFSRLIRFLS
jgi:hypothetical protein